MQETARVVVIGGGVVGCSVLYHLTKAGWKDVLLIERSQLTSGSSWHAAGGVHTLNGDPNVAKLQEYTINIYKEIEELSGQSCGLHLTGGMMLADTKERLEWLKMANARNKYLGIEAHILSASEAKELCPLIDEKHFVGAMYDANEGHLDPSGVTHAYAKAARINGANVVQNNRVVELVQRADGTWNVVTEQGTVHAEHVVNAGGLWAREVGRMVGLELPLLALEHMYLLTEDIPEVAEMNQVTGKEMLHIIDFAGEIYTRQERGGVLIGTYEKACVPWSPKQTPWDFGHELLQPDLERIAPSLEIAFRHFPSYERAGIRQVINGPFTFAPDGNPLVGPVRGLRNYWCACAVMAGFSQGGGVGLALANWMTQGDPGFDIWGMDVARYGDWATLAYTNAKVCENYSRRFRIRFPNEQLPAARPLLTSPVYDKLIAKNAVMGQSYGLEHALWFQEKNKKPVEDITFRRSNAFKQVAKECAAVRNAVGCLEISNFAKYKITGKGAEGWLRKILPAKMPKQGRIALTPMLNERGRLIGDFTLAHLQKQTYYIFGSGVAENYHMRWFEHHKPDDNSVSIEACGLDLMGFSIAGPNARTLLERLTDEDVSQEAFQFMDFRRMDLGVIPALVVRISFTGDLGYEIWLRPHYMRLAYDRLFEAGCDLGLKAFGGYALNSLRLEKSFGSWASEFRPVYGAFEAGFDRFVDLNRQEYIGHTAACAEKQEGAKRKLVAMRVAATDADVIGDEPIYHANEVIGWVTSGGYAHHSQVSVALGYVPAEIARERPDLEIEIIGERCQAKILNEPLFDPKAERMRG